MGQLHFEWLRLTLLPLLSCAICLPVRRRQRRCLPCPAAPGACRTPGLSPASSQSLGRHSGWCGRDAVRRRGKESVATLTLKSQKNQRVATQTFIFTLISTTPMALAGRLSMRCNKWLWARKIHGNNLPGGILGGDTHCYSNYCSVRKSSHHNFLQDAFL